MEKQLEHFEEKLKGIRYKLNLMRRWAIRFHCAFTGQTREGVLQKYQGKPSRELLMDVLGELRKYTDHLLGDEVLFLLFRTLLTRSIKPTCRLSQLLRCSRMTCRCVITGSGLPWMIRWSKKTEDMMAHQRRITCSITGER